MNDTIICPICGKKQLKSRLVCFYCEFDLTEILPLDCDINDENNKLSSSQQLAVKNVDLFSQVADLTAKNKSLDQSYYDLSNDYASLKNSCVNLRKNLDAAKEKCKSQYAAGYSDSKSSTRKFCVSFAIVCIMLATLSSIISYNVGSSSNKDTVYNDGYNVGYHVGYENGYDDGRKDGYNVGHEEGAADGYDRGYDLGYFNGEQDALSQARQSTTSSNGSGSSRDIAIADGYIGNVNSHKFHHSWCSYLPDQENQIVFSSREDAIAAGYDPCGRCYP